VHKIAIVGECPSTDARGKRILGSCLEEAGIDPTTCYITSLLKEDPPNGSFETLHEGKGFKKKPTGTLLSARERLKNELVSYGPDLIVAMGAEAFTALTDKFGITKWRGSVCDTPLGKVIGVTHPSYILRDWLARPVLVLDLQKAKRESEESWYLAPDIRLYTMPTMEAIRNYIADCHKEKTISFDIETESDQITCIGLSYSEKHAMCIPFWFGNSGSLWSEMDEKEIWTLLKFLLEDENVKKIAQNGTYDCEFLKRVYGITVRGFEWDTMLMAHTLYPELPKGLDFLTSIYTDIPYYKNKIKSDKMQEYFEYNAKDAVATYQIFKEQYKELKDANLGTFYREHSHALIEPLSAMIEAGVRFDTQKKKRSQGTDRERH
jgi:uracil-DNA glycosylase family 4